MPKLKFLDPAMPPPSFWKLGSGARSSSSAGAQEMRPWQRARPTFRMPHLILCGEVLSLGCVLRSAELETPAGSVLKRVLKLDPQPPELAR